MEPAKPPQQHPGPEQPSKISPVPAQVFAAEQKEWLWALLFDVTKDITVLPNPQARYRDVSTHMLAHYSYFFPKVLNTAPHERLKPVFRAVAEQDPSFSKFCKSLSVVTQERACRQSDVFLFFIFHALGVKFYTAAEVAEAYQAVIAHDAENAGYNSAKYGDVVFHAAKELHHMFCTRLSTELSCPDEWDDWVNGVHLRPSPQPPKKSCACGGVGCKMSLDIRRK